MFPHALSKLSIATVAGMQHAFFSMSFKEEIIVKDRYRSFSGTHGILYNCNQKHNWLHTGTYRCFWTVTTLSQNISLHW